MTRTIAQVQDRCIRMGLQWMEHVYNDDFYANCSVKFTFSTKPHYFTSFNICGDYGWGRFRREVCWQYVDAWLDDRENGTKERPAFKTKSYDQESAEEKERLEKVQRQKQTTETEDGDAPADT